MPLVLTLVIVGCAAWAMVPSWLFRGGTFLGPGSGPTSRSASGTGCAPVAGTGLVTLADDKKLQTADNVIPMISKPAASANLVAALDRASAKLDTAALVLLNKRTDVDHLSYSAAAQEFARSVHLTDGIVRGGSGPVVVGAANFSENQTIAEIYKLALTAAGYSVVIQTFSGRELYEPKVEQGSVTVMPEYAATVAEFLNARLNGTGAPRVASGDLSRTVSSLTSLGSRVGLSFGAAAAAVDQNGFAVTRAFAQRYQVSSLSDFARVCSGPETILGGPPECATRSFCQPGLEGTYKIRFGGFKSLDAGGPQTKQALTAGTISIGLVFTTDAALAPPS
jgi:osmoprotectant transport system substrate-binding protein